MFSKNHKLTRDGIENLFLERKGGEYHSSYAALYINQSLNKNIPAKFAFVVSKKTAKKAVSRNKLKRRARYIIQKHSNKIKNGYRGAFVFKSTAAKVSFDELELSILDLLKKTNLL